MQEPAPKGIIQAAEQPTLDLHKKVSDNLNKLDYPETTASVNPHDQSALEKIRQAIGDAKKDSVRVIGGIYEENVGGETRDTNVGTTAGKGPISIFKRKLFRKAA